MSNCKLAVLFDEEVGNSQSTALIPFDDSFSYMQKKQEIVTKLKKPIPPSQQAVKAFLTGETKSVQKMTTTFLYRSALIGGALFLFGDRRSIVKNSLVASGSIEAFLLYWYKFKKHN